MAIQDIPPDLTFTAMPSNLPGYYQELWKLMAPQIVAETNRAAQARGMYNSGEANLETAQALAQLGGNLTAQAGAAQQQRDLQKESEEAQKDLARQNANAQTKSAAIGGGTQALGSIAGLYAAKKMGLFGGGGGSPAATPAAAPAMAAAGGEAAAGVPEMLAAPTAETGGLQNMSLNAPIMAQGAPAAQDASLTAAGYPNFSLAGTAPAAAPSAFGGLGGTIGSSLTPGNLAGSGIAALLGSRAGERTFGGGTKADIGSGIGGLAGMLGGNAVLPGIGGPLGAAAGSFLGPQFMKHPGYLLNPIALAPAMFKPVGDFFNNIGSGIGGLF